MDIKKDHKNKDIMFFSDIKKLVLDLIFPPRCAGCLDLLPPRPKDIFCPKCRNEWNKHKTENCRKCGQAPGMCWCGIPQDKDGFVTSEHHLVQYDKNHTPVVKQLIYYMKHKNNDKVFDTAAKELYDSFYHGIDYNDLVICYVPRCQKNIRRFGHDQALKIASSFAKLTDLEIADVLIHEGSTNQKTLDAKQRLKNAKNAYQIINGAGKYIKGKNVILIDDVLTTGASVTRCAQLLKGKGANRVIVFTVAKTV